MRIQAFAAQQAGAPLLPYSYESVDPGRNEVLVQVTHCGICHSDLHLIQNDWRVSNYPLVPGHEVIGHVLQKGEDVHWLAVGQRVGIGWQAGSCMNCEWCITGQEQLCAQSKATCVGRHGGFGDHVVADARFAFAIPDLLPSAVAAPLLCGGITVYAPLRRYEVRHWHKVAVVGIGGLGHLALQFASAMGCEVTAISSSPNKAAEALALGAHHFVDSSQPGALAALGKSLDFILVTATADLDWQPYVRALRPNGQLVFVTGHSSKLNVATSSLLEHKAIKGSEIGGRALIQEMLAFAARKQIAAQTEVMPIAQVNEALDKVRNNTARYRMVLALE